MGHEHYRRAGFQRQFLQVVLHDHAGLGVQRPKRLIHQNNVGPVDQRARDRSSLLHAAGKLAWEMPLKALEANRTQRARNALGSFVRRDAAQQQRKLDVLGYALQ